VKTAEQPGTSHLYVLGWPVGLEALHGPVGNDCPRLCASEVACLASIVWGVGSKAVANMSPNMGPFNTSPTSLSSQLKLFSNGDVEGVVDAGTEGLELLVPLNSLVDGIETSTTLGLVCLFSPWRDHAYLLVPLYPPTTYPCAIEGPPRGRNAYGEPNSGSKLARLRDESAWGHFILSDLASSDLASGLS
jgi:hypothetical protein